VKSSLAVSSDRSPTPAVGTSLVILGLQLRLDEFPQVGTFERRSASRLRRCGALAWISFKERVGVGKPEPLSVIFPCPALRIATGARATDSEFEEDRQRHQAVPCLAGGWKAEGSGASFRVSRARNRDEPWPVPRCPVGKSFAASDRSFTIKIETVMPRRGFE
jgi:hypothetical protein